MAAYQSSYTGAEIDDSVSKRHTHSNKAILDSISNTDINNWNGKQDSATTLSGYGITDANITSRTVTLGNNSVYVLEILSGNSAPSANLGNNGDLYLQLV